MGRTKIDSADRDFAKNALAGHSRQVPGVVAPWALRPWLLRSAAEVTNASEPPCADSNESAALAWQVDVVKDVLHIIAIVQHADELLEHRQVFRLQCLAGLRKEGDLLDLQLGSRKRLQ